jgi:invasion protein IalB
MVDKEGLRSEERLNTEQSSQQSVRYRDWQTCCQAASIVFGRNEQQCAVSEFQQTVAVKDIKGDARTALMWPLA